MSWRALLRAVDVAELLNSQAALAESLAEAAEVHGPHAPTTRTLREGFNLLAKVLFTRRASIQDVHDLAWLDHLVVAKGTGLARTWEGDGARASWESLATNRGRLADLVPRRGASWADVPVPALGEASAVKLERGTAGPFRVGVVTHDGMLEFLSELGTASASATSARDLLLEVRRLAVATRQVGGESQALVFAAARL